MISTNNKNLFEYPDLRQFLGYMEKKYKLIEVVKFLAQGSYGKVYHARCNGQNFAIKVQKGKIGDAEKKLYDIMKKNKFSNLVNTIDYLEGQQFSYIMMEYCSRDLYHDIKNEKVEQSNIMYIVRQIAKGVQELHQNNIIHRDLKPENILIFEIKENNRIQLQYKIADFGTNFQINEEEELAKTLVGTPYYIAPEVGQDKKSYNLKADIWSLGVIIFELLLGQPPFYGNCIEDIQRQTRDKDEITQKLQYLYQKKEFHNYKLIDLISYTLNQDPKQRPSIQDIMKIIQPEICKSVEKKITPINQSLQPQVVLKQKSITIHEDDKGSISQNQQQQGNNLKYFNQFQQPPIPMNQIPSVSNNSRSLEPKNIQLNKQIISKSPEGTNQANNQIIQNTQMKIMKKQQQPPLKNTQNYFNQNQTTKTPQNPQCQPQPKIYQISQFIEGGSIDTNNYDIPQFIEDNSISTNQSDREKPQNDSQISNQSLISKNTQNNQNPKGRINKK